MPSISHDAPDLDSSSSLVAEYPVYWNQPSAPNKRILLLQFPNRNAKDVYNEARHSKPLEIRIKPQSGLVEVDVPIPVLHRYNVSKGVKYGQALNQSEARQAGNGTASGRAVKSEYGLAGGFGINAHMHARATRAGRAGVNLLGNLPAYEDSDEGGTLQHLTFGGRLRVFQHGDPIYAVGVFQHGALHLSKVDGLCSLQPQFHHLDALVENERVSSRSAAGAEHAGESEARAINMSVKSTEQEQLDMREVDKMLRAMQEEPWQRLEWVDQQDTRAMATFEQELVLTEPENAHQLVATMSEAQYLDAISAPRIDPRHQGKRVAISRAWDTGGADDDETKPLDGGNVEAIGTPKLKVELD